jgi:hypothetical protein
VGIEPTSVGGRDVSCEGRNEAPSRANRVPFAISTAIPWVSVIFPTRASERSGWLLTATFAAANEADAGTRTPDPVITNDEMSGYAA